MERDKLDLTDRDLYYLSLAIESHLSSRDTYWTKKNVKGFNQLIKKVVDIGLKRKDPRAILHPIMKFEDES